MAVPRWPKNEDAGLKSPFEAPSKLGTSQGKPFDSSRASQGKPFDPQGKPALPLRQKPTRKNKSRSLVATLLVMTAKTRRKAPGPATEKYVAVPWATTAFGVGTDKKRKRMPG